MRFYRETGAQSVQAQAVGASLQIGPTIWGSDGEHWDTIRMTHSLLEYRDKPELGFPTLEQDGRTVFRWAVWHTAEIVRKALDEAGLTVDDIDVFGMDHGFRQETILTRGN